MSDYFPTDVKLRFDGDHNAASDFVREARSLLFRAQLRQTSQPGMPVQLIKYLDNGGFISVELIDSQKTVTISVPFQPVTPPEEVGVDVESNNIYVLCGIKKGDSTVTVGGEQYLRSYRPSPATARSHRITDAYHDNKRLANTENAAKASSYSGAMKRVVAAVEGLGKIRDSSGYYLTPPSGVIRTVTNQYISSAAKTHGIVKTGTRNHWLVEISVLNGILAMPLPLIPSTTRASYLKYLRRIGDTGGFDICSEFGGLPSGETFPTGAALTTAIANGKVLRLATAADLSPFYASVSTESHTHAWSWAFSDTGTDVVNTRYNYKQIQGDPGFSLSGELWTIRLNLSAHNKLAQYPDPVGTGSYTLTMQHSGRISKECMGMFWGAGQGQTASVILQNYLSLPNIMDITPGSVVDPAPGIGWGCYLYAFYRGDSLELVKYMPKFLLAQGQRSYPVVIPIGSMAPEGAPYYQAWEQGWTTYSPDAIISSSVDIRKLNATFSEGIGGSVIYATNGVVAPSPGVPGHWEPIPNLDELLAFITWERGFGNPSAPPVTYYRYFAVVPGYCREGIVLNRLVPYAQATDPVGNTAIGVFDKLGVISIPSETNFWVFPSRYYNLYFSAVINPGPTAAYVMTERMAMQNQYAARPDLPTACTAVNVFAGTTPITTTQTTFIGSF